MSQPRGKRLVQLAIKNTNTCTSSSSTDYISDTEGDDEEQLGLWSDISDIDDPTYKPERPKSRKTYTCLYDKNYNFVNKGKSINKQPEESIQSHKNTQENERIFSNEDSKQSVIIPYTKNIVIDGKQICNLSEENIENIQVNSKGNLNENDIKNPKVVIQSMYRLQPQTTYTMNGLEETKKQRTLNWLISEVVDPKGEINPEKIEEINMFNESECSTDILENSLMNQNCKDYLRNAKKNIVLSEVNSSNGSELIDNLNEIIKVNYESDFSNNIVVNFQEDVLDKVTGTDNKFKENAFLEKESNFENKVTYEDNFSNITEVNNQEGILDKVTGTDNEFKENASLNKHLNSSQNAIDYLILKNSDKQKKKRTHCKFCRTVVTNFERHLERHHTEEKEIKDLLKFPKHTKEGRLMRRNIISLLRNQANFEKFIENEDFNPRNLPCAHCKRIVAASYLRRHYKKCCVKPINESGRNVRHRAASQTLATFASKHENTTATLRVKKEVFSRMATDEIGFVARKDPLIRCYGENYLKKHKRAQLSTACSNKMRECSRLLIEVRRRLGNPELTLIDILNPILFDDVVLSVKEISGYDADKKTYKAGSLADHMGTTLKQLCAEATDLLFMNSSDFKFDDNEFKLKEIKRFNFLVNSKWNNEVSSLALKDLAEKKWNKPAFLPLTEDIVIFRKHILETADRNAVLLKNNITDKKAYKNLINAVLAFTILFNRRRIGDVQYLETNSYLKNFTTNNQIEFLSQLTVSEKALTTSYKRVVAGGKGSRAIVILFPPNLQEYINLILDIRNKTDIVPKENPYLFAYPGVKDQWVRGDVVLKNFAKTSKVKNPNIMTSNRLRKQIATLMQILNLNSEDYSHFAKFMGHTEKTHKEFYEITQDIYQTAKIGKLLNLFDKGKGQEFKNQDLRTINIDPNTEVVESDDSETEKDNISKLKTKSLPKLTREDQSQSKTKFSIVNSYEDSDSSSDSEKSVKNKSCRIRWTEDQKKLVTSHFKQHIKKKKAPKKDECENLIMGNQDILNNLDWVKIKIFVCNTYNASKNK